MLDQSQPLVAEQPVSVPSPLKTHISTVGVIGTTSRFFVLDCFDKEATISHVDCLR